VTYSGTVTGLGSIVVNGVRFSTIGANTTDPDDPSKSYSDAFALGSSVTVTGTIDPTTGTLGQATSIVVHGGVRGVAGSLNNTDNSFVVSGQTVQVDANTLYADGASWANLDGMSVEVHGIVDANNVLLASRVEQDNGSTYPYAVVGKASNVDTQAGSFQITLSPGTTITLPIPIGVTLSDGVLVRVVSKRDPETSTYTATDLTSGDLKIIPKGERGLSGNTKIRGAITATVPDLMVNDIPVETTQNTKWDDGLALGSLAVGQVIKVEGRMSNGRLLAREIETDEREHKSGASEYRDRVKLYGVVSDSNAPENTFVVQGVTVKLSSGALPLVGSYVEVKAYLVDGVLTVRELENKNQTSSSRFESHGFTPCANGLDDLRVPEFSLTTAQGSLTVNGSAAREVKYDDDASNKTGTDNRYRCFLEVEGNVSGGVIQATKIEVKQRTIVTPR